MAKPLVIVESPAKARTLERFLGNRYAVMASVGHVRDLPESAKEIPDSIKKKPWGRMGVDVDADFTPYYVIPADKKPNVQKLKTALKDASEVLLATDPDREGESISWHLTEVLKPKIPVRRIEFHEITEEAVNDALKHARDINESLVRAQESRRIIDRLYGYSLSPVLWKKVQTGLSAGRVQSVAVRLIVEREEARRAFRTATYWDLEARLTGEGREFPATLVRIGEARVATGKDFDPATGALKTRGVRHLEEDAARRLAGLLERQLPWQVTSVDEKPGVERPAPPFTTSTLTQEASRKLGFSTARTMQIAQRLFQGIEVGNGEMEGLITYHRTDSTTLSEKALNESARVIRRHVWRRVLQRPAPLSDEGEERAGSARGDPADRFPHGAGAAGVDARQRRPAPVRVDLEAHDGVANGGRACEKDERRDRRVHRRGRTGDLHRHGEGDRVRRLPPRLRRGQRRSAGGARGSGDDPSGMPRRRSGLRAGRDARRARRARVPRHRAEEARDGAAGTVHGSGVDQGAGGGRHRPSIHLCLDHRDHPEPRLRVPPGQGTGPVVHRLCGDRVAATALHRLRRRRLHRRDGRSARRDQQRRAQLARFRPHVLSRRRQACRARQVDRDEDQRDRLSRLSISAQTPRAASRSRFASAAMGHSFSAATAARATRRRCPTICRRPM